MAKLIEITGKVLSGEWGTDDESGNGIPVLRTTNFTNEGMHDKRIKYFAAADYSEGRELDTLVKAIIDRTAYNEKLETMHYKNLNEAAASEEK